MITRFAPTPNGPMHRGHLITHLLIWLIARHHNGEILFRVDDTDRERFRQAFLDGFLKVHEYLGLSFDEGPIYQSERTEHYQAQALEAVRDGKAYYCECSRRDVAAAATANVPDLGDVYPGTCRNKNLKQGKIRFIINENEASFVDELVGPITQQLAGDPIIVGKDGTPAYHWTSCLFDHEFGITDVIRGKDLLASTALHTLLIEQSCRYWHVPLVLDEQGLKLSKSDNAEGIVTSVLQAAPEVTLGEIAYEARLVATPKAISLDELATGFSPNQIKF